MIFLFGTIITLASGYSLLNGDDSLVTKLCFIINLLVIILLAIDFVFKKFIKIPDRKLKPETEEMIRHSVENMKNGKVGKTFNPEDYRDL